MANAMMLITDFNEVTNHALEVIKMHLINMQAQQAVCTFLHFPSQQPMASFSPPIALL
jgi:hypothetical protein